MSSEKDCRLLFALEASAREFAGCNVAALVQKFVLREDSDREVGADENTFAQEWRWEGIFQSGLWLDPCGPAHSDNKCTTTSCYWHMTAGNIEAKISSGNAVNSTATINEPFSDIRAAASEET